MEANARVHLIISGRVQGVFFRAETQRAASMYGVTGWVRNKRDGTVEAIVEGRRPDVESLVNWCRHGPPSASVAGVDVSWHPYEGAFREFSITY